MSVAVGDRAPDFTLPTDGGGEVSLKALKGKKLVLYFYPKDDTPGCTREACAFRDSLPDFSKIKATILGVSKDSVASHDNFKTKFELPFPLASDADGKVCEAYGVWVEKSIRKEVHGHRTLDLPHRREGRHPQHLAQGEGGRPRRRRAEGRGGAEVTAIAVTTTSRRARPCRGGQAS
jgi:peroxiredoxin Q/BCP